MYIVNFILSYHHDQQLLTTDSEPIPMMNEVETTFVILVSAGMHVLLLFVLFYMSLAAMSVVEGCLDDIAAVSYFR